MKMPFLNIIGKMFVRRIDEKAEHKTRLALNQISKKITASLGNRGSTFGNRGGGSKYTRGLSASGSSILFRNQEVMQNARDSFHDVPQAKIIVNRFADTVVDIGLKVKPTPKSEILGISADEAEKWAEDTAERFDLWAKSKKSHRSRINNFYQNQRMYQVMSKRDGEVFTRLFYSKEKDTHNPLQLSFVEPNQICGYGVTSTYAQYKFDDGIIRDDANRETGYKIWSIEQDGSLKQRTIQAMGARSKRTQMMHGYNPLYVDQGRGLSALGDALQELEKITDFSLAQIQKAINQSSIFMSTEPSKDAPASNVLEQQIAGPTSSQSFGSSPTDEGLQSVGVNDPVEPIVSWQNIPEATLDDPGSVYVANLQAGEKLQPFGSTAPSDSYDNFVNSFFSYLSAAVGMPVEVALMKFGQNYSASRGALIMYWRVAMIEREEMNSDFNNPIYHSWLSEEIAAGRIKAPGWSDPLLKEAWLNAEWTGAPMPNIDPMKTAKADLMYAEMGAQTLDDIARNHNGSSGKANRSKNARQFAEITPSPFQKAAPGVK